MNLQKQMIMEENDTTRIRKVRIMAPAMLNGKDLNPEFGDLADDAIRGDHCLWMTTAGVLWKVTWAANRASVSLLDANGNDIDESARILIGRAKEAADEWRGGRPGLVLKWETRQKDGVTNGIELRYFWF